MQTLGDIAGDRLAVDCATCRRHGSYRLDGLMARFGPEIATLDLLRALTATCRHQRGPGAKVTRKYESHCLAALRLPKAVSLGAPVSPRTPSPLRFGTRAATSSCASASSTRLTARSRRSRLFKMLTRKTRLSSDRPAECCASVSGLMRRLVQTPTRDMFNT
ncbi:hypothetical protein ABIE45_004394 [Methylobacterium sp. OAE515]|uniref:hypothetical protein n=1 Tax=Methylobacterium sp. OAE515 TaxID=2817895 RepID=UPI00359D3797